MEFGTKVKIEPPDLKLNIIQKIKELLLKILDRKTPSLILLLLIIYFLVRKIKNLSKIADSKNSLQKLRYILTSPFCFALRRISPIERVGL